MEICSTNDNVHLCHAQHFHATISFNFLAPDDIVAVVISLSSGVLTCVQNLIMSVTHARYKDTPLQARYNHLHVILEDDFT
jgi:hypothetical protein